jgi:hypothetical protein
MSITEAGGLPLHITSNSTSRNSLTSYSHSYVSEDFCLPNGAWTIKMNVAPGGTHPEMKFLDYALLDKLNASHQTCVDAGACRNFETITYEPVLDHAWCLFGVNLENPVVYPWAVYWGIFPSGNRAEAELASKDPVTGLRYLAENRFNKAWAYESGYWLEHGKNGDDQKMVPAPDKTCWKDSGSNSYFGPCPRTKAGDKIYNNSRLSRFSYNHVVTCRGPGNDDTYGPCPRIDDTNDVTA